MTDGCSECGETRDLDVSTGKCPRHHAAHVRALELGERILATCAKVLDSMNQNLLDGDVLGCVRDVAQMAMAAKEDWKPVNCGCGCGRTDGTVHVVTGLRGRDGEQFTVGPVHSSRTHDNKGAPLGRSIAEVITDSALFARKSREESRRQDAEVAALQKEHDRLAAQIPFLTIYEWGAARNGAREVERVRSILVASRAKQVYLNPEDVKHLTPYCPLIGASGPLLGHMFGAAWLSDTRIQVGSFGVAP